LTLFVAVVFVAVVLILQVKGLMSTWSSELHTSLERVNLCKREY